MESQPGKWSSDMSRNRRFILAMANKLAVLICASQLVRNGSQLQHLHGLLPLLIHRRSLVERPFESSSLVLQLQRRGGSRLSKEIPQAYNRFKPFGGWSRPAVHQKPLGPLRSRRHQLQLVPLNEVSSFSLLGIPHKRHSIQWNKLVIACQDFHANVSFCNFA